MARRFFIETFGCQMNEHDSEKISGLLAHRGMVPVYSPEEADLFLLNTCSVREKASQKVYSRLGELKSRKQTEPGFIIGVVGCVAQQEGEEMVNRAPFVDLVVGTHLYHELPDLLDRVERDRGRGPSFNRVATRFLDDSSPVEIESVLRANGHRANITIMEGCNKHCSFCIVPFTRGKERNRPALQILDEVRRVVAQGYFEILLLGQTVNSYRDPTRRGFKFSHLLSAAAEIPGVRRLRFTSPHPKHFDDGTIDVIASRPNICNHVHLPLQSGSTRVLRKMRRQYTREWFERLVEKFNDCGRPISFSTDMIVGFPGETEADFEETLSLVRAVRFESMFSFKYSPRPHTEACQWEDSVPEFEKGRRLMMLQRMQRQIQLDVHRHRYLDRVFEIVVEGTARDGKQRYGRTTTNKIVNFPGRSEPGQLEQVLITGFGPNSLIGRRLEKAV